jgi:hypothetical protein
MLPAYIASTENLNAPWPDIWSHEVWKNKKKDYPWLTCRDGKLGCDICSKVSISVHKRPGVAISAEWAQCCISYYGQSREAKLTSLRKKMKEHKDSTAHSMAERISREAESKTLEKVVDSMTKSEEDATTKVMRTAYYIAKNDRPYSDHHNLVELQILNGVDMGIGLHSRFSATNIIDHISSQMRQNVCAEIKKIEGKISIAIDESTTLSNLATLIIYLKCETSKDCDPHFMFLDLIELPDQTALTITSVLLQCLKKFGFDDNYLKCNLVAFASDGASVMLGNKSGVASNLLKMYPHLIVWHCLSHRLELAVSDAVGEITAVNHFQIFFDKLYSLYSSSPKNMSELKECAKCVEEQVRKIGRLFSIRWIASSFRTVSAVWDNYQSLCTHFQEASCDTRRASKDRAMFLGLLKRIRSPEFLVDLGVMYDALFELSSLSEILQHRCTSLVYADKLMRRTIRVLQTMKEKGGNKTFEAKTAAKEMKFKTITLTTNKKLSIINEKQFFSSLINNMNSRLFCTTSSHNTKNVMGASLTVQSQQYDDLLKTFAVLDRDSWPVDLIPGYGENEVKSMCHRFGLSTVTTVNAYRDFVDDIGRREPPDLKPLLNCMYVIPCSTAECERGFSTMNIIVNEKRSNLLVSHVSSLMFIKLHGPPLSIWKPQDYVKGWLRHHRSATDTQTRRVKSDLNTHRESDTLWKYL